MAFGAYSIFLGESSVVVNLHLHHLGQLRSFGQEPEVILDLDESSNWAVLFWVQLRCDPPSLKYLGSSKTQRSPCDLMEPRIP